MHRLETEIEVNASAARVWSLLTDFPAFERWNPFIRSIEGKAEAGSQLGVFLQPPRGRGMRIHPRVLVVVPGRELRWKGRL